MAKDGDFSVGELLVNKTFSIFLLVKFILNLVSYICFLTKAKELIRYEVVDKK
jgi:hypothetical protein